MARLSEYDTDRSIAVKTINESLEMDRTEIKNILEYLDDLGYLQIETIGGPLLYGHVSITAEGLKKASEKPS